MGDDAGGFLAGGFVVLLAEDLRGDGVVRIEEPSGDVDAAVCCREGAEGDHGGIGRRGGPLGQVDLLGRTGSGLRRETLGDQVEDAGTAQVAIEGGVEDGLQGRGLGIVAGGIEVRGGEADAFGAEIAAGVDPVLGGELGREEIHQ